MKINQASNEELKDNTKRFSLFGSIPEVAFNVKAKKSTLFGFLGSTLMLSWVILSWVVSFKDMVLQRNPTVVTSTTREINQGVEDFNVGIGFVKKHAGTYLYDPSIYTVKFIHWKQDPSIAINNRLIPLETIIPTVNCTRDHFTQSRYMSADFTGGCMPIGQVPNIGTMFNEGLIIQVRKCSNSTSPITCKSQSVIDQSFLDYELFVAYNDVYIDSSSLDYPIMDQVGFNLFTGSNSMKKEILMLIQELSFTTDHGFLFPESHTSNHVGVQTIKTDANDGNNPEYQFSVHKTGLKTKYKRTFAKLQTALAGAFSLVRVISVFQLFFIAPFANTSSYQEMIQDIFSLKYQLEEEKQPPQTKNNHKGGIKRSITLKPCGKQKGFKPNFQKMKGFTAKKVPYAPSQQQKSSKVAPLPRISQFQKLQLEHSPSNSPLTSHRQDQQTDQVMLPPINGSVNQKHSENVEQFSQLPQGYEFQDPQVLDQPQQDDKPLETEAQTFELEHSGNQQQVLEPNQQNNQSTVNFKVDKNGFSLSLFTWLQNQIPWYDSIKKQFYNHGKAKIHSDLMVTNILKKMVEIERLKILLLDESQRVIFENLPKPSAFDTISKKIMTPEEKEKEISDHYKLISDRIYKTSVDSKLLEWFDTEEVPL